MYLCVNVIATTVPFNQALQGPYQHQSINKITKQTTKREIHARSICRNVAQPLKISQSIERNVEIDKRVLSTSHSMISVA